MERLKVAVVGCGDVAQHTYVPALKQRHDEGHLALVALVDQIEGRAEQLARQYGIPNAYTNASRLFETDVDLIVNLTPAQAHARLTLDAIAAGKHVYTEKPLASSLEDADAIIDAAAEAGVTVAAAPALLVHPDVQQALRWLRGGLIGKICFARARGSHPGPDRLPDFRTDPSWFYLSGAGPLIDLGIYPLHVLTGALGAAKRVTAVSGIAIPDRVAGYGTARGKPIEIQVDDNTHLLLDFGDATFATVDATYCVLSSKGPRMEFYGAAGVMNLASTLDEPPIEVFRIAPQSGLRGWITPEAVYRGRVSPPRRPREAPAYSLASGVDHLIAHLQHKTPLLLTAEHARHVLEIIVATYQAAREGRTVILTTTFPPPAIDNPTATSS